MPWRRVQYYMEYNAHSEIISFAKKFGAKDPTLWVKVRLPAPSPHLPRASHPLSSLPLPLPRSLCYFQTADLRW
jgi:hypothetical protein